MESPEAWRYAHQVFGQTWMRWGTILLLAMLPTERALQERQAGGGKKSGAKGRKKRR